MKQMTEAQRQKSLQQANDIIELLTPLFERDDVNEEQLDQAVNLYSQAIIVKARISSAITTRSDT